MELSKKPFNPWKRMPKNKVKRSGTRKGRRKSEKGKSPVAMPPSPIWEYFELHEIRSFDSGDRVSYGHGPTRLVRTVIVDGEPIEVSCLIGKPSKYTGARQFVS